MIEFLINYGRAIQIILGAGTGIFFVLGFIAIFKKW